LSLFWIKIKVYLRFKKNPKILDGIVYANIKFHENPSSGSRSVACGRTDRHDEANIRFCSFANAPEARCRLTDRLLKSIVAAVSSNTSPRTDIISQSVHRGKIWPPTSLAFVA
jgi:hypothetical protein